jgi:hypothetical protein
MYDARLKSPATVLVAGPTQSGKSTLVANILSNGQDIFSEPRCLQNVTWFYKEWQTLYDNISGVQFINAIPTEEHIKDIAQPFSSKGGSIIVLDDFMQQVNQDISTLFSTLAHHLNITVFFITQNLFSKNPVYRDISLNSTYIILFKNPRDRSQVSLFAKQYAPGKSSVITEIFKKATATPHSYVMFDTHQATPDIMRIRSDILGSIGPPVVWAEKCST